MSSAAVAERHLDNVPAASPAATQARAGAQPAVECRNLGVRFFTDRRSVTALSGIDQCTARMSASCMKPGGSAAKKSAATRSMTRLRIGAGKRENGSPTRRGSIPASPSSLTSTVWPASVHSMATANDARGGTQPHWMRRRRPATGHSEY